MEIIKVPDPVLHEKCSQVSLPLSTEDSKTLNALYSYVKENSDKAVGLAAPQIGVSKRMFAIYYKYKIAGKDVLLNLKMVNPEVIPCYKNRHYYVPGGEGCLSEPGVHVSVKRYERVILRGYDDISKKFVNINLSMFPAAIAQHEMDHLNGILLEDRIS